MFLVSSQAALRARWRRVLHRQFAVEEITNWAQVVWRLAEVRPQVVLLDENFRGLRGADSVARLQMLSPASHIVILTQSEDERDGIAALKAGARGYCSAELRPALLRRLVHRIQLGEIWVGRRVISNVLDELFGLTGPHQPQSSRHVDVPAPAPSRPLDERVHRLTPREMEIVRLLGNGCRNKEIAEHLRLAEKTVKSHLTAAFRKFGVSNRLQLALLVTHAG